MEKKEVQKLVKDRLRKLGFKSKGNTFYKVINDDYMIGLYMTHSSYSKSYMFDFGCIYLVDEDKDAEIKGVFSFDYGESFWFTNPNKRISIYDMIKKGDKGKGLWYFQYDVRSEEEFIEQFDVNLKKCLNQYQDKEFVLNICRERWPVSTPINMEYKAKKIYRMLGIDYKVIGCFRD